MTSDTRQANGWRLKGPSYFAESRHFGRHFVSITQYRDRSPDFRSQLGFFNCVDIREASHTTGYRWRLRDRIVRPEFDLSMTQSTTLTLWHERNAVLPNGTLLRPLFGNLATQPERRDKRRDRERMNLGWGRGHLSRRLGLNQDTQDSANWDAGRPHERPAFLPVDQQDVRLDLSPQSYCLRLTTVKIVGQGGGHPRIWN